MLSSIWIRSDVPLVRACARCQPWLLQLPSCRVTRCYRRHPHCLRSPAPKLQRSPSPSTGLPRGSHCPVSRPCASPKLCPPLFSTIYPVAIHRRPAIARTMPHNSARTRRTARSITGSVLLQKHNEALVARIRSLDLKGLRFVSRRQTESIARNAAHKRVPTPWHSLFAQPFSSVDQELRGPSIDL